MKKLKNMLVYVSYFEKKTSINIYLVYCERKQFTVYFKIYQIVIFELSHWIEASIEI